MKMFDYDAYQLLKKYGIPVAKYDLAKTKADAWKMAKGIGYPVYMKVDSPDIVHKAALGCVDIVKQDADKAFDRMMTKARKITGNINGIIIQEQLSGVEAIVGAKRDEQFGPVVMFGTGGPMAEAAKDTVFRLVHLSRKDASEMIDSTKIGVFLNKKGFKKHKLEKIILNVSRLIDKNKDIAELDINPVFLPAGVAADVRIILQKGFSH
ncbi:MAG: acetate--CoA ligase family protein [Candidatus Aenigmarchaeota archaeon]|nr:acetate--CoA ligase family protein [Candidatus Aenigmarchaeota archaeon]